MSQPINVNNNNQQPAVAQTGFVFQQKADAATLQIGNRKFTITGVRFKDFGADKFIDISLKPALIRRIQHMLQGREAEFTDLQEFTITIEEAFGVTEYLQEGQKSHYFFDPRRIMEKPTHLQLFASGQLKCELCFFKNSRDIKKASLKHETRPQLIMTQLKKLLSLL